MRQQFQFEDFTLDQSRYRLQRGTRLLRLEKLPMELLILLVQRSGQLVSREEIAERLRDKNVFLDVDHSVFPITHNENPIAFSRGHKIPFLLATVENRDGDNERNRDVSPTIPHSR